MILEKLNFILAYRSSFIKWNIYSMYIEKVLKCFNMKKAWALSAPMVVRSLDVKRHLFRPQEDNEEILGLEVPYLSVIEALIVQDGIAFFVNLLSR